GNTDARLATTSIWSAVMVASTLTMKSLLRILTWAAVAAVIMWWPTRPTSFNARWVAMPSAMTREMFTTARRAAERPTGMTYTYCNWPISKRICPYRAGRLALAASISASFCLFGTAFVLCPGLAVLVVLRMDQTALYKGFRIRGYQNCSGQWLAEAKKP